MTFRITVVLRLSGHLDSESVAGLRAEVSHPRANVLDLGEVTLVVVPCARYIREWMDRERGRLRRP